MDTKSALQYEKIEINDITEEWAVFSLMGPLSRNVLSKLLQVTYKMRIFPFGTCRKIEIKGHTVLALRITYVGELGWELHMPCSSAEPVYEALMDEGNIWNCKCRLSCYRITASGERIS